MKKIFALVAVAMVSATAFVSCTGKASVESLKELAAKETKTAEDSAKIVEMIGELQKDTTLTEADVISRDSIAAIYCGAEATQAPEAPQAAEPVAEPEATTEATEPAAEATEATEATEAPAEVKE